MKTNKGPAMLAHYSRIARIRPKALPEPELSFTSNTWDWIDKLIAMGDKQLQEWKRLFLAEYHRQKLKPVKVERCFLLSHIHINGSQISRFNPKD